ncbi:MAG: ABC transporter permease, partial [Lachnospiraceae bacterium]|nr:ABC transporter permease [Lachnospiraceae bacterium]
MKMKKFIKLLPAIVLETLLFGLVLLAVGAYASKAVYGEKAIGEIRVGIVSEGEDKMTGMLLKFVESMDSVKDTVSFVRLTNEEARQGIREEEIYAAVIIPEGMADSILSGENTPVKILLGSAYSRAETDIFVQFTKAGAKLLTTAQAGIYAADALCLERGWEEGIPWTENYLNEAYLKYALERTSLFKEKEIRAVSGVGIGDYYGISLLLAFLSFAGLAFGRYMQTQAGERERLFWCRGLGRGQQYLLETAAFGSVFALLGMVVSVPVYMLLIKLGNSSFEVSWTWIWMAAVWFSAGILIRALIQIFGNHAAGIGISFAVLMAMMTAAGIFIPPAFLPMWVEKIGNYIPYQTWAEGMAAALQGSFDGAQAGRILLIT